MDADQSALLAATLRGVFGSPRDDIEGQLAELGWDEVLAEDRAAATSMLFAEQGRALASTALLDRVVLHALGVEADAFCYPLLTSGSSPSSRAGALSGVLLREPRAGATVAVPVGGPTGTGLALLPVDALTVTPLSTFDLDLTWFTVSGSGRDDLTPAPLWETAVAAAHRALAAEVLGTAHEVLRLAVEHTSTRTQFGAPIAAFQAVRHRLADAHVAISAAQALLDAAFLEGSATSASAAKAQAGRAHEQAAAHALQVCGAMGSSLEHPLHRFVSRGTVLDALLGGWTEQVSALGRLVRTTGSTPLLIEV